MRQAKRNFSAVLLREEDGWVGFIVEITGVNCQGRTRRELLINLRSALREALEIRRELALAEVGRERAYEEEAILV